jgi:hypothetical protein
MMNIIDFHPYRHCERREAISSCFREIASSLRFSQ